MLRVINADLKKKKKITLVLEVQPKCQVYCIEVFRVGNSRWAGDIDIKGRAERVLEGRATAASGSG
jgi:hypothetical protein